MKKNRVLLCILLTLAISGSMTACGKQKDDTAAEESTTTALEVIEVNADAEGNTDASIDKEDTTAGNEESASGQETDTVSAESTSVAESTASGSGNNGAADNTSGSASDGNAASAVSGGGSGSSSSPSDTSASDTSAQAGDSDEPDTEENTVAGTIHLGSGTFEGEGISISGSTITITGEGTYVLDGAMTGMVEVNSTQKVKLKLNGVNITNPSGPAILCTDAKRLTITLIEGTSNTLTDGTTNDYDGAICSNDTLEIKGSGTLTVNATNAHGISCDDDIIIKNGNITINAVKTGMMANDDITISGGTLHVTGGTNGVKSKGTLHISGGSLWATGGPKEKKSALYSAGAFTLTGGYVYAVGCGASEPDASTSTQSAISVKFSPSLSAGSTASLSSGGTELLSTSPSGAFHTVFISTPELYDGMNFNVNANGSDLGNFTVSGSMTYVTAGS
jgi:hypothetical protein